jgi:release factor glutamine methyltransferase
MSENEAQSPAHGMTRARALAETRAYLKRFDIEAAEFDARALLFAACGIDASEMLLNPDVALSGSEAARLREFAARRARREPVSRIVGRRAFWTVDLTVRPDVLDPRADTEALVRLAIRIFRDRGQAPGRILDLGSGSGAVLCALLSEFHGATGQAVDLSRQACAATAENLQACGFDRRAGVAQGSWFDAVTERFDLIVSNPPYIPTQEIEGLDLEVRAHDPHLALDGGRDGLEAYRAILAEAPHYLTEAGAICLEFGSGQGLWVDRIAAAGGFRKIGAERDLGGRERAVAFCAKAWQFNNLYA